MVKRRKHRRYNGKRRVQLAVFMTGLLSLTYFVSRPPTPAPVWKSEVTKQAIAEAVDSSINQNQFPDHLQLMIEKERRSLKVTYTLDEDLQAEMQKQLKAYRPDYAAFVALDPKSGRVRAMVSYAREKHDLGNLALKAAFPAASVFKIVTAAAAIDAQRVAPETVIPFNGGMHTLYRRNVLGNTVNRWTNRMTLREAFARSANTFFAKIGVFLLDPPHIEEYAQRFQFNRAIAADVLVQAGTLQIPSDDDLYARAELASGFNRIALMSPLQGAMIGAAIANDGRMMEPFMVENLRDDRGALQYEAVPKPVIDTVSVEAALGLRSLMRETVSRGTSRQAFRRLRVRKEYASVDIGGKTGSLTGLHPRGRCDWFVGYAQGKGKRLAIAALTVNRDLWRVKSSALASLAIEQYFRDPR